MNQNVDRREFLRTAGTLSAVVAASGLAPSWAAAAPLKLSSPQAEKLGWRLSCSLYTFRSVPCYEALDKIAALGIRGIEPAFFLPLSKDQPNLKTNESLATDVRQQLRQKLEERGQRMVNFYGNVAGNQDENRKIFEFAKQLNVETIVAEPPAAAFDAIEKLCDEFQINLAVHNHPQSPQSQYWHPDNVLKVCQGRGKRIGACCDTGHWVRSGLDAVECLKKMEGRILTMHLKDVIESGNPAARDVPLGTGKANYAAVLKELHRQHFRGALSIEYEHESPQLMDDVAQCVAFVEQTVALW
jgi:sugar phosphate isomerase/epimerase